MSLPDYAYCKHCGRVICWDDWSYMHLDGWANCRNPDKPDELAEGTHCEPLLTHPIEPQPAGLAAAMDIPRIGIVVGEDGAKHYWRRGEPMPVLKMNGAAA